jgi:hypothetical protein
MQPSPLAHPLATVAQLETSGSQLDGIPADLEDSIRFASARLTQAAGVLLRLPQEVIAQAIVTLSRFWLGPEGGSLAEHDAGVGCWYLASNCGNANTLHSKSRPALSTSPPNCLPFPSLREASSMSTPTSTPSQLPSSSQINCNSTKSPTNTMSRKGHIRSEERRYSTWSNAY